MLVRDQEVGGSNPLAPTNLSTTSNKLQPERILAVDKFVGNVNSGDSSLEPPDSHHHVEGIPSRTQYAIFVDALGATIGA